MGFSSQGKNAHSALIARQDAEIRLIEVMRRCLSQKAKSDREYATAISNVAQQGLKIDRPDDLIGTKRLNNLFMCVFLSLTKMLIILNRIYHAVGIGSQIFQAWKKFLEETETQSKLIRSNADHLENLTNDRMIQMHQDKRKLRKQCQEEHNKIASPLYQVINAHFFYFFFCFSTSLSTERDLHLFSF